MSAKPRTLLHLGCGFGRLDGWVNCDLHPTPTTDMVFDVQERWPFEDSQSQEMYASHMLEHLQNYRAFFKEAWRVLEPNGGLVLRVPYGMHKLAWADPTHVKAWYAESFCFLQPGYGHSVANPQEVFWDSPFGIAFVNLRLAAKWAKFVRNRFTRRVLLKYAENIENAIEEMWIFLYALKDQGAVEEYRNRRPPNTVPARYVIYQHHYEKRADLRPGEYPALKVLEGMDYTARYGFEHVPS